MLEEDRRLKKPDMEFNRQRPTVLIVDDDRHDLELMTRALAADDLLIRTADSAHAAFELLALHGADIIVTDYRMPGTNGIDFLGNVRKLYPSILRTVITGTDEPPTLSRAVNSAGIHKYLSKSWSAERLRAEVRQTLFGGAELPQN
jgi:response regulator RpfG family c-di-GMP phosphodiesterase